MLKSFIYKSYILGIIYNPKSACNDVLSDGLQEVLKDAYTVLMVAVPILVTLLCVVDILRAVVAQDEKDMSIAQARAIKRVIIGMITFFIPLLLDIVLELAGFASGTCGIGG
jgi:hypothetical protein